MVHVPPSGQQYTIGAGAHRATIVEVGGGVREYAVGDRQVLEPYPLDEQCDGAHGTPLVPWPNRLDGGRYTFDGHEYQVPVTEPAKNNAIHGLLRWRNWQAVGHGPDAVTMTTRLHPSTGYPFVLDVAVSYTLDESAGLTVTTTATNVGGRACPYGSGQHPYLSPGSGLIDDCTLTLAAATWIDTDNPRQLPAGRRPTADSPVDFTTGTQLGGQQIDLAFTDLSRDADDRAWVLLTAANGSRVELWVDGSYPLVELYTGDTLAPDRRRKGLGAEPMTCPPNAFRSGEHLRRLEPGDTVTHRWGVRLR